MDIQSKIAIVTGASRGLGAAVSTALVEEKAGCVYGLARDAVALSALHKKLGRNFVPVTLDITLHAEVKAWAGKTFSGNALPDILINNAGAGSFARIDEMPTDEWHAMVNTNLNGTYHITSEVVKLMRKKKSCSHIINIGSILGITTRSEGAAYCATKYAINGFSDALFKELRGDHIKVTCVNPGSIATDFFKSSGIAPHQNMLQPGDVADMLIHVLQTPDNFLINEMTVRPLNPQVPHTTKQE
ncbi:MAG: SDR family NAD(P)-dependent oxidoreductase [Bacteroidetes bacterium]|nr:SDR family NAD(P)-dependent oxidoreductase [Bacteroidota bacterium]MBS1974517.1 SDR family NAD(P)-dependent oxidoreductase [Bacteroidota bacterium]